MEVTGLLFQATPRVFVDEDMVEGALFFIEPGAAVVYSSRCPGKQTPNEDAALLVPCGEESCVLAVADGVGGARSGMEASSLAMDALKAAVEKGLAHGDDLRDAILNGFEAANHAVLEMGVGAATTLAVVEIQKARVRPYHVGDSFIFVVGQRGRIRLQTISHSPVGYGVEGGFIDEREALYHEERHVVSNVIGSEDMRIDVGSALELAARDTLLVASDGLSDNLQTDEIVRAIRKGPLNRAGAELAQQGKKRMLGAEGRIPSKPDDLTFVMFRLSTSAGARRRR